MEVVRDKTVVTGTIIKKSFNEEGVTIKYNDDAHTYEYRGNMLNSATSIVSKFYKSFNSKAVSQNCAKSWNQDAQDIVNLWDSNGKLASAFGNVVHEALEHYDKFSIMAKEIAEHKGEDEDRAMPKHPLLRNIVQGFVDINETEGEEVIPEALITDVESGYCGHADRVLILDRKKKVCRVQDYKINIGSEEEKSSLKAGKPFDKLPKNKITKYQLQMSVYANMLQKSGWTVEGLDVFVYEDEWKHFPLEVLDVLYNE